LAIYASFVRDAAIVFLPQASTSVLTQADARVDIFIGLGKSGSAYMALLNKPVIEMTTASFSNLS
jgi:hypothetical protein